MPIKVSKTYEVVTPESAEQGDAEERGFEFEDADYTFGELVRELKDYPYPSESHGTPRWVTSAEDIDFTNGHSTTYSLHPGRDERSQRYWAKACRAAGITK